MASVVATIRFEVDLIRDGIDTLCRIHTCLASRHGERFRDLERRIEAEFHGPCSRMGEQRLEPGLMVLTPPPAWAVLIADARSMGVI